MKEYKTAGEGETEALAASFAKTLKPGDVVAFRGGLGAGKTAFVRGMAAGMGISARVSSPTFALVHEYAGETATLYHFDMYRVEDVDSLESTGFFDYLDGRSILAVEWSENIAGALPDNAIIVTMEHTGGDSRRVLIETKGGATP